ncbi:tRNA pseudouridine(55) synthase TruB [Geomicrobium sp. JCM 19039]|uniref:tRNA pseudouridine(55) synthase TruB n=1 Tax=Geomicrobium sp. JCM 19039 TaxID=1460636 RepID=UPI00045F2F6E|nr:tRNA pseudouridine(55) synthase TruB [Geomicrobium sp. JCM 19039]GAK10964.1 tRNA pseudouridine synthase B [Geomicrobium sp. JCM 19039]
MVQSGILPLYKPAGYTSFDLVVQARRWFKTKEIGHAGTLDPSVTGVLLICVGRATKLVPILMEQKKAYDGVAALGEATTTEDREGDVIAHASISRVPSQADVDQAIANFNGTLQQVPPMYSAVKVKGKRLYEYARAGETVDRPVRTVTIYDMKRNGEVVETSSGHIHIPFSVTCSKGTYVRTLAVDLGKALGFPAHLHQLTRTMSAGITDRHCVTVEDMEMASERGNADEKLLRVDDVLQDIQHVEVPLPVANQVKNGAVFQADLFPDAKRMVLTHQGKCLPYINNTKTNQVKLNLK